MKWLIYGGKGWIGSKVSDILKEQGENVVLGQKRADNIVEIEEEIRTILPDRVIVSIGRVSGPGYNNIDYLEQPGKLVENIRDNLFSIFNLAFITNKYNIHMTYFGTGCIFSGYKNFTGFSEDDVPNFFGSSYSTVKGFTDQMITNFPNVLNARIRMPIMDDNNPKNFIIKLLGFKKICSIPNSMSVLPELIPVLINMAKEMKSGTINLTNPGIITHNEILQLVKKYHLPDLEWENFTIDDQKKVLKADRSNNMLDAQKLCSQYKVKNILVSVEDIIKNMRF